MSEPESTMPRRDPSAGSPGLSEFHFFTRRAEGKDRPGGTTVSRRGTLPNGDFGITEYVWPRATLWFVDADHFSADDRQAAFMAFMGF